MKLLQLLSVKFSLLILITITPIWLKSQVFQSDLDALKSLYYATGGDQWHNKTNWDMNADQNDVNNSWYGITVENFRITKIKLAANNLNGHIPEEIENLEMLQYFDISQNDVDSISIDADILVHIDTLLLSYNEFVNFPVVVCNYDSLRVLEISLNKLTQIPPEIGQLKLLQTLKLNSNKIKSIPSEIKELKQLRELDISNNPLKMLISEIYSLSNLISLNASNDSLSQISPSIKNLKLQKLNLSYNQLDSIPADLVNISTLNNIDFSHNKIKSLAFGFSSFFALEVLNLSYNQITQFPGGLTGATFLKELQVQNNQISNCENLSASIMLSRLNLENNRLSFNNLDSLKIDWSLLSFSTISPQAYLPIIKSYQTDKLKLQVDALGDRNVYQWYKNFEPIDGQNSGVILVDTTQSAVYQCLVSDAYYPRLILQSDAVGLKIVNGVLAGDYLALVDLYNATGGENWFSNANWLSSDSVQLWKGLSVKNYRVSSINLANNNLMGTLPETLGNLNACETLTLSNNKLNNLGSGIGNLSALMRLDVSNNLLSNIPSTIGELKKLEILLLNKNSISELPTEIGGLAALQTLNIAYNQLRTIPSQIGAISLLKYLELNNNFLSSFPPEIGLLNSLWKLNAANNLLDSIPSELGGMPELLMLYLNNNQITHLPSLKNMHKISRIYLAENYLDFSDFDADSLAFDTLLEAIYYPQKNIELLVNRNTENYVLSVAVGGINNQYQWFSDSMAIDAQVADNLVIALNEKAVFYANVQNAAYPLLTLKTAGIHFPSQIPVNEYNALLELYNTCNGDLWTDNTNWLSSAPADEWFGVNVINYEVKSVLLPNNQLLGFIPVEIGQLTGLQSLDLSNNQLSGTLPSSIGLLNNLQTLGLSNNSIQGEVPADIKNMAALSNLYLQHNEFTQLPNLAGMSKLEQVNVAYNKLGFDDLEANIFMQATSFIYSPQDTFGLSKEYIRFEGEQLFLEIFTDGYFNLYQWYKDGEILANQNNNSLQIQHFAFQDIGIYHCVVSNSLVPDLALISASMVVNQLFKIKFFISDAKGLVKNAQVELENYGQKLSNIVGEAQFDSIAAGSELGYQINASGHYTFSDDLLLDNQDLSINVYLGITDIAKYGEMLISVFPNPVSDVLEIKFAGVQNTGNWQLHILDINGKILLTESFVAPAHRFNLQNLSSGIYFLVLKSSDGEIIRHKVQKM